MRAQVAAWYHRDGASRGELESLREGHRRAVEALARSEAQRQSEGTLLRGENELLHERVLECDRLLQNAQAEIERVHGVLQSVYGSRTWRLHLFLERLRGR